MLLQQYNSTDDPFERLKNRILLRMREEKTDQQVLGLVKDAFTENLRTENIILSQAEHERLFRAVSKEILDDVLNDL